MAASGSGTIFVFSMHLDLEKPGEFDLYALATHVVLPRPIAWVTTTGHAGVVNLAPFSYFGLVSDEPILMVLSVARRKGVHKDTARNLLDQGEAVVHVVEEALFESMVLSSKDLKPDESETVLTGLTTVASSRVKPPRLERASVALECRVDQHLEVGSDANDLFLLRAVYAHVSDDAGEGGIPDPVRLRVLGKLGASHYAVTAVTRTLKRPK